MSDRNDLSEAELYKALFVNLVVSLASSAMQHMGKIVNPATGKAEIDLEAAQSTIDMMDMLEVKTRGNRDDEEERLLRNAISSLQLNFVETAQAAPADKPSAADTPPPPAQGDAKPKGDDEDRTRFRKSYG